MSVEVTSDNVLPGEGLILLLSLGASPPGDPGAAGGHGGNHVEVEGSFDNWTMRQPMQRSGKDFTIVKLLPPGVYQVSVPAVCPHISGVAASALSPLDPFCLAAAFADAFEPRLSITTSNRTTWLKREIESQDSAQDLACAVG